MRVREAVASVGWPDGALGDAIAVLLAATNIAERLVTLPDLAANQRDPTAPTVAAARALLEGVAGRRRKGTPVTRRVVPLRRAVVAVVEQFGKLYAEANIAARRALVIQAQDQIERLTAKRPPSDETHEALRLATARWRWGSPAGVPTKAKAAMKLLDTIGLLTEFESALKRSLAGDRTSSK